jgi:hypothetical protein
LLASVVVFLGIVDFSFERVAGWSCSECDFASNRLFDISGGHLFTKT